jgi:8-oxo-dGTP pyrophosphatase MutT (NUDIX family)
MPQIYKIYMNQSALILTHFDKKSEPGLQYIDTQNFDLKSLYERINQNNLAQSFVLQTDKPKSLLRKIRKSVRYIKAAGGLVTNASQEYLFIRRLGKWDLPKGKVESQEKMKAAAVREVEEECGLEIKALGPKISSTYHMYSMGGEVVLKKTNWYAMQVDGCPPLVPQLEEDITEAVWLSAGELGQVRENTYPLIRDLIAGLA